MTNERKEPQPMECPFCRLKLDHHLWAVCPRCELDWQPLGENHELIPGDIRSRSDSLRLPLKESFQPAPFVLMLSVGLLGYATALVCLFDFASSATGRGWSVLALGLGLGFCVGTCCAYVVISWLLQRFVPSELEGDGRVLRLRLWKTWVSGWGKAYQRTDMAVPADAVKGVALRAGQGGWECDSQIVLLHVSGLAFGIGWRGPKSEALRLGRIVADWIAAGLDNTRVKSVAI